jgi:hypothetical protein
MASDHSVFGLSGTLRVSSSDCLLPHLALAHVLPYLNLYVAALGTLAF